MTQKTEILELLEKPYYATGGFVFIYRGGSYGRKNYIIWQC